MNICLFVVKNNIHGTKNKDIMPVFNVKEIKDKTYFLIYDEEINRFKYRESRYFSPVDYPEVNS